MEKYRKKIISLILLFVLIFLFFLILPYFSKIFKEIYLILKPFLIALVFAFATHGLVDRIENAKVNRGIAVFIVVFGILYLLILIIMNIIPLFFKQLTEFLDILPEFLDKVNEILFNFFEKIRFLTKNDFNQDIVNNYIEDKIDILNNLNMNSLIDFFKSISNLVFIPMITIYILYDYNNIRNFIKNKMQNNIKAYNILKEIEIQFSKYIKGIFLVVLLLSLGAIIGFMIIDLDYAIFLGLFIGVTNVIPIVGQYIGGIFVALFALTKSVRLMIETVTVILVLQLIESNFLTPYIQSKTTKINPLWILLGFIAFSRWFGFVGCLLAIPLTSIIKIIIDNVIVNRLK